MQPSIDLSATNISIVGGNFTNIVAGSTTLTAMMMPTNHTNGNISWCTSDAKVLTINAESPSYYCSLTNTLLGKVISSTNFIGTTSD